MERTHSERQRAQVERTDLKQRTELKPTRLAQLKRLRPRSTRRRRPHRLVLGIGIGHELTSRSRSSRRYIARLLARVQLFH